MLAGIAGDIIGSVYEAYQWQRKDMPLIGVHIDDPDCVPLFKDMNWVRKDQSWTDDTLCSLALFQAYYLGEDPSDCLRFLCKKYQTETVGFGKSFRAWLDNPVPYNSYGNGCLMRIGFIPELDLSLDEQQSLAYEYTVITHNHEDSVKAVSDYIQLCDQLKHSTCPNLVLDAYITMNPEVKTVDAYHDARGFEMNALTTLHQAVSIVRESNSLESVYRNSLYVGGDTDTLACIAGNIGSCIYRLPDFVMGLVESKLSKYTDLELILNDYMSLKNAETLSLC